MDWRNFVVGGKDATIPQVVGALSKSPCYGTLLGKLSTLRIAMLLEDKSASWKQMSLSLTMGAKTLDDAMIKILEDWVLESSEAATLAKLESILRDNEMVDLANYLKAGFTSTPRQSPQVVGPNVGSPVSDIDESSAALNFGKYDPVTLSFGKLDVKNEVLPKISHELTQVLTNTVVNKSIILELMDLEIFDGPEINPVLSGEYRTEQDRILSLLEVFRGRNSDEITLCLERLCNLDNSLMSKKEHFRKYFSNKFKGSVQKRI